MTETIDVMKWGPNSQETRGSSLYVHMAVIGQNRHKQRLLMLLLGDVTTRRS